MKNIKLFGIITLFLLSFYACQEQSELIDNIDYPREFSPTGLKADEVLHNRATVKWAALANGSERYFLELYTDSLLFLPENLVTTVSVEYENSYTFEGLLSELQYSIRIKALGTGEENNSKWHAIAFKTNAEQIMMPCSDIKTTKVIVNWRANEEVTHLAFRASNLDEYKVELDEADIVAGTKVISGLIPNTNYTVSIYNGENRRGKQSFATAFRPIGENVMELSNGDDLKAVVEDAGNAGKIIVLLEGFAYTSTAKIVIPGDITIYGDPDGNKPVITGTEAGGGKWMFDLPLEGQSVTFVNLELTSTEAANGYSIIDQNVTQQVGVIKFDNCYIHDITRAFIRLRGANQVVEKLEVNNCIFEDVGYSGSNANFVYTGDNAAFKEIIFTNTTFNKCDYNQNFIDLKAVVPVGVTLFTINFSDCTFYNVIGGNNSSRYLLNVNTFDSNISINNCLFGKTWDLSDGMNVFFVSKLDLTKSILTGVNNYKTSDWKTITNVDKPDEIPDLKSTGSGVSGIFVDPENGNFKIKAGSVKDVGDPRWR